MRIPFTRRAGDPRVRTPDDQMTLTQHLAELRTRIIRSLLAVVVGIIVLLAMYDQVLDFLRRPYTQLCKDKPQLVGKCDLQFLGPLEGFTTRLSIATYGGIILALPVILWQVWRFVVPALHAKERKYAVPFVLSSVVLFVMGGAVAYWTLTPALDFLISWSGSGVEPNFQVSKYVSLVGLMIGAFCVTFEFPVLLVFLQLVGAVRPRTLLQKWRFAVMGIFVVAAVITPSGDPISLLALAVPMSVMYGLAVLIGWLLVRKRPA